MRTAALGLIVSLAIGLPAFADSQDSVAKEVIALAKAQWAAGIAQDTDKVISYLADDYTEFNGDYPTRIDGKELNASMRRAFAEGGSRQLLSDMANAKVQVYGDVAILTYNFMGSTLTSDGRVEANLAKSTRVYAKVDGNWTLVHANFAPAD